jgi:hypothetical protein
MARRRFTERQGKAGLSIRAIAKQSGISRTSVRSIIKGYTYKNIVMENTR